MVAGTFYKRVCFASLLSCLHLYQTYIARMAYLSSLASAGQKTPSRQAIRVSDGLGSFPPPTLRKMTSRLSISIGSLRWKSPSSGGSEDGTFPSPPADQDRTPTANAPTPSRSGSIRKRRGRFRPLSVITSALVPFDPFGSMESPPLAQSQDKSAHQVPEIPQTGSASVMTQSQDSAEGNEESSESAAQPQDNIACEHICADFDILTSTPPPLLNEHPMWRSDPFSVTCDSPLMTSTSTSSEIRDYIRQMKKHQEESRLSTPSTALTISPIRTTAQNSSDSSKSSLRKMSNIFKSRSSSDSKTSTSASLFPVTPNLDRPDLVGERESREMLITKALLGTLSANYPSLPCLCLL